MLKKLQTKMVRAGRRTLRTISSKNYYLARSYGVWNLHFRRSNQAPLIVYQMGKVGSTTVINSLRALDLNRPLYHVHGLTQERITAMERVYKEDFPDKRYIASHFLASLYLRKQMAKESADQKWKVVTLIRDPIARNMSSFFQLITIKSVVADRQWQLKSVAHDFEITVTDDNLEELITLFFERFKHETPLTYFDREFKSIFNLDLYATDFPTTKGYKIYQAENAEVLLLRLKDLKHCAPEAFKKFLNVDDFKLASGNIGSQKEYAHLYQLFKNTISFPKDYLDKMYASKFARHFYSEAELEAFRAKWSKKRVLAHEQHKIIKQGI